MDPLCATWANPRSQLVPPVEVRPSIQVLTVPAPAAVETGVSGRFWLFVVFAGAEVAKVNSASWEGEPTREYVKVYAADFRLGTAVPTEPEVSTINATLSPHFAGSVGFTLEFCQMPPEASTLSFPVPSMKVALMPLDA